MDIRCSSNIDAYRSVQWPILGFVPRKGEIVYVSEVSKSYCQYNRIPPRLEVTGVHYKDGHVSIDLWFNETDHKLYNGPYILEHGHNRDKVDYYDYIKKN